MKNIENCPICNSTAFTDKLITKDFTVSKQPFGIRQCVNCTLLITSPRPDDEELGNYYLSEDYISHSNRSSNLFQQLYFLARRFTLQWKWNLIAKHAPGNTLIDYGCGTGAFLEAIQKKGMNAWGVEPSTIAREIAAKSLKPGTVVAKLDESPSSAHIITLWHVLEHVPDLQTSVRQLKARLHRGGIIFLAVPNPNSWESAYYKSFWAGYDTPRHLWHFTRTSMEKLLSAVNLRLIDIEPMRLDPYYISLLSEKYKRNGKHSITGIKNAIVHGLKSNNYGNKTGVYSSLIYIAKNED